MDQSSKVDHRHDPKNPKSLKSPEKLFRTLPAVSISGPRESASSYHVILFLGVFRSNIS